MFKIPHSKRLRPFWGAAIAMMFILTLWQVSTWTENISLTLLRNEANRDLERYVVSLQSKLAKYESLPRLLATHDNLVQVLLHPEDNDQVARANQYLETIKNITGASNIFVMDTTGLTLAAANWNTNISSIGNKYDFRPYFKQALKGELGRYFALALTSEEQAYFFAYQVRRNGAILGVVAERINLRSLESQRTLEEDQFLVTDEDGVIFLSTREQWIFRTLRPLSEEAMKKIKKDQKYPIEELIPLPVSSKRSFGEAAHMLTIRAPGSSGTGSDEDIHYLMLGSSMPEAGWKVHVLSNLAPVRKQVLWASVLTGSTFISLVLVALFLLERRKAIQSRLAGFEQMTGSIRHELVRSMSPIKSLADNACSFPDLKQDVRENLTGISQHIDRMTQITSQLEAAFIRQTPGQVVSMPLQVVVDDVLDILETEITRQGTEIIRDNPAEEFCVLANMVQIQQVFVNLITNALEAMENSEHRVLTIRTRATADKVRITIRDTGPGIPEQDLPRIFTPFFTTKQEGALGLGLLICSRILNNLKGTIRAANHPDGGARFILELPRDRSSEGVET